MKKKILIIFIALSLVLLPACGGGGSQSPESSVASSTPPSTSITPIDDGSQNGETSSPSPSTSATPTDGGSQNGETSATPTDEDYVPGGEASFTFTSSWDVTTDGDSLESGYHQASAGAGISVSNLGGTSLSVLRDIRYYIEADNIESFIYDEYAEMEDNAVTWNFPSEFDIAVGDWLWCGYTGKDKDTVAVPVSLSRDIDNTVFETDGYQHAEFTISFDSIDFNSAYIQIIADEDDQVEDVDAFFSVDTFSTDVPYTDVLKMDEHKIYLRIFAPEIYQITPSQEYTLSVDVRVQLKTSSGLPIVYKPYFSVGMEESQSETSPQRAQEIEMPEHLLPAHVIKATVSTNAYVTWLLSAFRQRTVALNEICE
jgi:hypothetical protein